MSLVDKSASLCQGKHHCLRSSNYTKSENEVQIKKGDGSLLECTAHFSYPRRLLALLRYADSGVSLVVNKAGGIPDSERCLYF